MTKDNKSRNVAPIDKMPILVTTRVVIDQTAKTRTIEMFSGDDAPDKAKEYAERRARLVSNRPVAVFALISAYGQSVASLDVDAEPGPGSSSDG